MQIQLGSQQIDHNTPCHVIAELSGNHNGTLSQALALMEAAAAAGADSIKIQLYRADTITLNSDHPDFQIPKHSAWNHHRTLYQLYEHAHTPWEWLPELFRKAEVLNIPLFGSVFDLSSVDVLADYGTAAYKIASPEIVDIALLERVAKSGKPVLISTGVGRLTEISTAVDVLREHGCEQYAILKCTTAYPTPYTEVNLRNMQNISQTFGCIAGLSDHTHGIGVALAAVALGARVIEKHIRLEDDRDAVDGFFSLPPSEFAQMVEEIRHVEAALGVGSYELTPSAIANSHGKRSLYVAEPIRIGEPFTEQNIRSVRPGYGLAPKFLPLIIGRRAVRDMTIGEPLKWPDVGEMVL